MAKRPPNQMPAQTTAVPMAAHIQGSSFEADGFMTQGATASPPSVIAA